MAASPYQPDTAILRALLLIGLALGGSMFYVLVFPAKPKPISCPPATCIDIPLGVSSNGLLNFAPFNVTRLKAGSSVQWKNHDEAPHTATATQAPPGAAKFDSGELDSGNTFFVQLNTPGVYLYHCAFHRWMKGAVTVTP